MNRQEAIEVIKRKEWAYYSSVPSLYRGIMKKYNEAVKVLEQPVTLADLLGWEVGVEYEDEDGFKYRLKEPNELQAYYRLNRKWESLIAVLSDRRMDRLRKAEKVEQKKKYRIPLPYLTTIDGLRQYLTEGDDHWFASRLNETLKQEWTEDELSNIPNAYRGYAKEVVE